MGDCDNTVSNGEVVFVIVTGPGAINQLPHETLCLNGQW